MDENSTGHRLVIILLGKLQDKHEQGFSKLLTTLIASVLLQGTELKWLKVKLSRLRDFGVHRGVTTVLPPTSTRPEDKFWALFYAFTNKHSSLPQLSAFRPKLL